MVFLSIKLNDEIWWSDILRTLVGTFSTTGITGITGL